MIPENMPCKTCTHPKLSHGRYLPHNGDDYCVACASDSRVYIPAYHDFVADNLTYLLFKHLNKEATNQYDIR